MCRPFDKNEAYFYPSRKLVTVAFLSLMLQIPYIVNWDSADAWLSIRCFYVIYIPLISTLALRKYFFFDVHRKKHIYLSVASAVPVLIMLVMFGFACAGGSTLMQWRSIVLCITALASILLTAYLLHVTKWLARQISDYQHGEYSNDDDFPIRFARGLIYLPIIMWSVAWIIFVLDSRILNAVFSVFLAIVGLILLIVILHPQRVKLSSVEGPVEKVIEENLKIEEDSTELPGIGEDLSAVKKELPDYLVDKLEQQIRTAVCDEQLFLQPRLNKTDLAKQLGTNRTYLTIVFRDRFVSFYSYVNTLRIKYALNYAESHQGATQQEIAYNSGFGSVKTYMRVKKLYEANKLS